MRCDAMQCRGGGVRSPLPLPLPLSLSACLPSPINRQTAKLPAVANKPPNRQTVKPSSTSSCSCSYHVIHAVTQTPKLPPCSSPGVPNPFPGRSPSGPVQPSPAQPNPVHSAQPSPTQPVESTHNSSASNTTATAPQQNGTEPEPEQNQNQNQNTTQHNTTPLTNFILPAPGGEGMYFLACCAAVVVFGEPPGM